MPHISQWTMVPAVAMSNSIKEQYGQNRISLFSAIATTPVRDDLSGEDCPDAGCLAILGPTPPTVSRA